MARLLSGAQLSAILLLVLLLALGGVSACSEDPTEPTNDGVWDRLAGTWDALHASIDGETADLASGNLYWYFNDRGAYCEKLRLAYGYESTSCGTASPEYVLEERVLAGVGRRWQLEVSADADTLVATLLQVAGDSQTCFVFVRGDSAPEADCFCD